MSQHRASPRPSHDSLEPLDDWEQADRAAMRELAVLAWGPMVAFDLAALGAPLRGPVVQRVELVAMLLVVAVAGWLLCRTPMGSVIMAACSYEFFHVGPDRHLEFVPLLGLLLVFLPAGWFAGVTGRRTQTARS